MPIDKQPQGSATKPITPVLSSRFRSAKTPVAPKLAGSTPAPSATISRREPHGQPLSPLTDQSRPQPLNGNVTPRSGARIARISTESPSSPAVSRRVSGGSSISGVLSSSRPALSTGSPSIYSPGQVRPLLRANVSSPSIPRRSSNGSDIFKKDEENTKFVLANDAKIRPRLQPSKSALSPRPPTTSAINNGSPRSAGSAPPSVVNSARFAQKDQKFVRATDAQVRSGGSPVLIRKQSTASIISNKSSQSRSLEGAQSQNQTLPSVQTIDRTSPKSIKVPITNKESPLLKQYPSQSSPAAVKSSSPSDRTKSFNSTMSSSFSTRPMLHRKSASVSTFGPPPKFITSPVLTALRPESAWISPAVVIPSQSTPYPVSSPESLSPRSASLASSKTVGTSVTSDTDFSEISKAGVPLPLASQPDSAVHSSILQQLGNTPLAQAQMQAANARRERKVLDLEISNSSLLAINKTLEKELKKQSAELRRFRRLSRSGRLSFAPSNRSVSGQSAISLDTLQEQSEDDDDYSEDDEDEDEDNGSDFEAVPKEMDGRLQDSPGGMTARARQRARDERRLMLDLSKHQQLLVDSQKLTQSIRKCLNLSESLIKEGTQALNYKVGIGDLKLGGRVLSGEEDDVDHAVGDGEKNADTTRKGLLTPSMTRMELEEAALWLSNGEIPNAAIDPYIHDAQDPG